MAPCYFHYNYYHYFHVQMTLRQFCIKGNNYWIYNILALSPDIYHSYFLFNRFSASSFMKRDLQFICIALENEEYSLKYINVLYSSIHSKMVYCFLPFQTLFWVRKLTNIKKITSEVINEAATAKAVLWTLATHRTQVIL